VHAVLALPMCACCSRRRLLQARHGLSRGPQRQPPVGLCGSQSGRSQTRYVAGPRRHRPIVDRRQWSVRHSRRVLQEPGSPRQSTPVLRRDEQHAPIDTVVAVSCHALAMICLRKAFVPRHHRALPHTCERERGTLELCR
jgi:hypothetical protein